MKNKNMKKSERYFNKLTAKRWNWKGKMTCSLSLGELKIYGNICRLEGKIFATNSYGTDHYLETILPKLKDRLKNIIRNNEL